MLMEISWATVEVGSRVRTGIVALRIAARIVHPYLGRSVGAA